ncbi:hypothetical protein KIH74_22780 [Kineosporia sp. J2-2]|uniref:Uncharacterized protein n=1 Tax=Kineosporia corallincola TaxID=2835133 RepID=A0ABS5TL03_9ACTN|nr:hypothetical protein [Kineosporia corallincola]MBT0771784.1 hypothetical protein [Kineosporia corallincola]
MSNNLDGIVSDRADVDAWIAGQAQRIADAAAQEEAGLVERISYLGCTVAVYRTQPPTEGWPEGHFSYSILPDGVDPQYINRSGSWASAEDALACGKAAARTHAEAYAQIDAGVIPGRTVTIGADPIGTVVADILAESRRASGNCHYCGLPVGPKGCQECV